MALWRSISCSAVCLALLAAIAACFPAQAQQSGQQTMLALGVRPAIAEMVVEPGRMQKLTVAVTNLMSVALPIKTTAAPFQINEGVAHKDRAIFDASRWVQFAEPDFILHPKQQKTVELTLSPPANAEPGGHYATIFFQPLVPAEIIKNNAALVGSKVGILTLLTVRGDLQEQASITHFGAPRLSQQGPIKLQLDIKNSGNVHFMPTGSVEIYDIRNKHIDTIPLTPTIVLPKTIKNISLTWNNKQKTGYFSAKAIVKYGTKQASLTSQSNSFLIFPWFICVASIGAVGSGAFVFWKARGRWRRAWRALFR